MNWLNQSFTFKNGVVAKNRFVKAAMSEQLAGKDNRPNPLYPRLYHHWAMGGAGILITGNVMVDAGALGSNFDVVLENERDLDTFKAWAAAGTQNNTLLLMQLNHPGKQSPKDLSPQPVAPSAIPLENGLSAFFNLPRPMTESDISDVIQRFTNAAVIAEKAGFSGVQIHAAHGYLLSQFLSPHHNRRQDRWGGSIENRMRLLLEIYHAVRRATSSNFLISVKLNSADFQKGGFSEEESMQVVQALSDAGVDLIEISGGNYESPTMLTGMKESSRQREAYFLDYALKVRQLSQVPLVITGGFRSASAMESALAEKQLDFVGIAKPFAVQPDLPNRIFNGQYQTLHLPPIRTGVNAIDKKLASILEMAWYMYQMKQISQNKQPNPKLSAWRLLVNLLWTKGKAGFMKERHSA